MSKDPALSIEVVHKKICR